MAPSEQSPERAWEKAQEALRKALDGHRKADEARRMLGTTHPDANHALRIAGQELNRATAAYTEASRRYLAYLQGLRG